MKTVIVIAKAETPGMFGYTMSAEVLRQAGAELNRRFQGFSYDEESEALVYAGPWGSEEMLPYVNGYIAGMVDRMEQAA